MNKKYSHKISVFTCKAAKCARKISIILAVVFLIIITLFIYKNCIEISGNARVAASLKRQVAANIINVDLYNKIVKHIEWKRQALTGDFKTISAFE